MPLRCKFEELDNETRDYLHDVKARKGRGTPGVFIAKSSMRPLLAIMIGPTLAFAMISIAHSSTNDPWAIAALQTAGIMIGAWCVSYAVRRWMSKRSKIFGGRFCYFDPLNAYDVSGETVSVVSLQSVKSVTPLPGAPRVAFEFKGDRDEVMAVPTGKDADLVADYYEAMADLESGTRGDWSKVTPAELGAAAVFCVEEDDVPRDVNELRLDVDEVPRPTKANRAGFGIVPLALILMGGAFTFFVLSQANPPIHDDIAFDQAKADGAPGLRGYLLDERNTRHRDEAKELLAAAYDPAIAKLQNAPKATNQPVRDGMIELVKSLKTSESPAVALEVIETPFGGAATPGSTGEARTLRLRTELANALARGVDPKLIAFAAPAEGKKPHILIRYQFITERQNNVQAFASGYVAEVEIEIRTDIAKEPVVKHKWIEAINFPMGLTPFEFDTKGVDEMKLRLCRDLVGGFTPAPPPVNEFEDF